MKRFSFTYLFGSDFSVLKVSVPPTGPQSSLFDRFSWNIFKDSNMTDSSEVFILPYLVGGTERLETEKLGFDTVIHN